ncbi:MAG: hypothetical protein R3231_01725 [bacterium]|nr:hypothetical protein [bacterium]
MKFSIIFLLEEENDRFLDFLEQTDNIFAKRTDGYEILVIANGTGGFLRNLMAAHPINNPKVRALEMTNRTSQAICLKSTLKDCEGDYLVVCGSYQQVTAASFENLVDMVDHETDILAPWRQNRSDPAIYKIQSDFFNKMVRAITGSQYHDLSCNVRIIRRQVLEETELYGNMYRFLPIFAAQKGFATREVPCDQNVDHGEPRQARGGVYRLPIYLSRTIDIFTLYFNTSFTKKPLRFFSSVGFTFFLTGLLTTLYIFGQKLFFGSPVGNRPVLILAVFLMVTGIQAASIGLLGEIIVFTYGRHKKDYVVDKVI